MSAAKSGKESFGEQAVECLAQPRTRFSPPQAHCGAEKGVSMCLVVSIDPLRQLMFGNAAERTGWKRIVCDNLAAARQLVLGGRVAVAVVDLPRPRQMDCNSECEKGRDFVEWLVREAGVLTVACGRSESPEEEAWARQIGVWVYLPGVAPESDLDSVLKGARQIKSRIRFDAAHAATTARYRAFSEEGL
jgi:hypothetical protein